jgi:hypothetical protein
VTAWPPLARTGTLVHITFTASETLAADPVVTVNGNPSVSATKPDNQYTCSYTMKADDPMGPATITIAGTDRVGYEASIVNQTALRHVSQNFVGDWMIYE